jgi:hypothetical protein
MENKMNIYQKLQTVRVKLHKMNLKKSGFNPFAKFNYFELGDFLPAAQELMLEHGLFAYEEIDTQQATITVIDTDDLNVIPFVLTMPSTTVDLKGATPIQNLGSVQTYMRRYLWTSLLEIVESDALDATIGKDDDKKSGKKSTQPKKEGTSDAITELKTICTAKSKEGKQSEVLAILERVTGVKNPNAIKDTYKAIKAIEELNKL